MPKITNRRADRKKREVAAIEQRLRDIALGAHGPSNTSIEWCDATWNPIRARVKADAEQIAAGRGHLSITQIAKKQAGKLGQHCEHVSEGCRNCWAEAHNHRCLPGNGTGLPFDRRSRELVDIVVDEAILGQPLKWRKPKLIAVQLGSDLFGEWVPDALIHRVFHVMADSVGRHVFLVLTKRARRACEYRQEFGKHGYLPNVWFGVSVEDQWTYEERVSWLWKIPCPGRFVSAEPLLGSIETGDLLSRIDWIIAGGESGPGARLCQSHWISSLRDQCIVSETPFLFKQWGAFLPDCQNPWMTEAGHALASPSGGIRVGKQRAGRLLDGRTYDEFPHALQGFACAQESHA